MLYQFPRLSLEAQAGDSTEVERLYNQACVVCHGDGAEGAPRPGVKAEWEPRLTYGVDELYLSAIEGLGPTMPPRGMCNECSDSQLESVVDYMIRDLK